MLVQTSRAVLGQNEHVAKRRPSKHRQIERPLSVDATHWRSDGLAKTRYDSEREGQAAAGYQYQERRVELSVYRCGYCAGWHLGRQRGQED